MTTTFLRASRRPAPARRQHHLALASLLSLASVAALAGCGGNVAGPPQAPPDGPVTGTVVDALGLPTPGVSLLFEDKVVWTDGAGHFTLAYAPSTYDVAMAASPTDAYVFQGLTSRTPTLRAWSSFLVPSAEHSASVTLGAPAGLAANRRVVMTALVPQGVNHVAYGGPIEVGVSASLVWTGDPTLAVRAYAIAYEYDPATNAPTRYVADVLEPLAPLRDGDTATWFPHLADRAIPQTTLPIDAHLGGEWAMNQSALAIQPRADSDEVLWLYGPTTSSPFSLLVPTDAASLGLYVSAQSGRSGVELRVNGVVADGKAIALDATDVPATFAPEDGAKGIGAGSELSWSFQGATSLVSITPNGADGPAYSIVTRGGSARIPDLTKLGVVLPSHASYAWNEWATEGSVSVDEFAARGKAPDAPAGTTRVRIAGNRLFTTP